MYTESKAIFLYCTSPVHMGAGTAVGGLIDNPIQRERHTCHPLFAGSGIKGALRHRFGADDTWSKDEVDTIFGPEKSASDHAGATSFSDAQLVTFPVRSLKNAFVYATCPAALGRTKRQLRLSGVSVSWEVPVISSDQALICNNNLMSGDGNLALESFQFNAKTSDELATIASWFANNALYHGDANKFFINKLTQDLVLLSDTDFSYFVENTTSVEAHVKIDEESGTAKAGGLFYTENLPPESLLLTTMMASGGRAKGSELTATQVVQKLHSSLGGQMIQIGGDSTTGRGQVVAHVVGTEGDV